MLAHLTSKIKNAIGNCPLKVKQRQVNIVLFDNIDQLPHDDWAKATGTDVFWSSNYHRALEKGCSDNVSFRYILIYDNSEPAAACYVQVINLKNLSLKTVLNPGYFENIYSKMNGMGDDFAFGKNETGANYLCICGNLFVSGSYGISNAGAEALHPLKKTFGAIMDLVEKSMEPGATVFATALKDFEPEHLTPPVEISLNGVAPAINGKKVAGAHGKKLLTATACREFNEAGFFDFEIDPDMVLHLQPSWKSYSDYLASFSSKYRVRANSAEAKAKTLSIKNFNAEEIKNHSVTITTLFDAVIQNAPVRIASNTAKYFEELKLHLDEKFIFKAFMNGDQLLAFSTAVVNNECLHAHHIGLNYKLNKDYALYQNMLYHYVDDGIALNKQYINFGRDALEIKSTLGAAPLTLKLFVKFSNSITQLILQSFLKLAKPKDWTQRKPFRV